MEERRLGAESNIWSDFLKVRFCLSNVFEIFDNCYSRNGSMGSIRRDMTALAQDLTHSRINFLCLRGVVGIRIEGYFVAGLEKGLTDLQTKQFSAGVNG